YRLTMPGVAAAIAPITSEAAIIGRMVSSGRHMPQRPEQMLSRNAGRRPGARKIPQILKTGLTEPPVAGGAAGHPTPSAARLGNDADIGLRLLPPFRPELLRVVVGDGAADDHLLAMLPVGRRRHL